MNLKDLTLQEVINKWRFDDIPKDELEEFIKEWNESGKHFVELSLVTDENGNTNLLIKEI